MAKEHILPEGMTARLERNVRILGLVDPSNPYWYRIQQSDGTIEEVNVSRLRWFTDDPRATIDYDSSVQIFTPKLTARGAINLYHWLRTNLTQLEAAAAATTSDGATKSGNESPAPERSTM